MKSDLIYLKGARRQIAEVAQAVYDGWSQDLDDGWGEVVLYDRGYPTFRKDVGSGGICEIIADQICLILRERGLMCERVSHPEQQHALVAV